LEYEEITVTNAVNKQKTTFGDHYLVDLHGCDPDLISTVEGVRNILMDAAIKSKSTIIDDRFHQFEPFGASGVIIIAESHFSVHTWPEDDFAAVDIFTSGELMQPQIAIDIMTAGYAADYVNVTKVTRGSLANQRMQKSRSRDY